MHAHVEEKGRRMRTHACMHMPGGRRTRRRRRKERKKETCLFQEVAGNEPLYKKEEEKKERKKETCLSQELAGYVPLYKDVACSSKHIIMMFIIFITSSFPKIRACRPQQRYHYVKRSPYMVLDLKLTIQQSVLQPCNFIIASSDLVCRGNIINGSIIHITRPVGI